MKTPQTQTATHEPHDEATGSLYRKLILEPDDGISETDKINFIMTVTNTQ